MIMDCYGNYPDYKHSAGGVALSPYHPFKQRSPKRYPQAAIIFHDGIVRSPNNSFDRFRYRTALYRPNYSDSIFEYNQSNSHDNSSFGHDHPCDSFRITPVYPYQQHHYIPHKIDGGPRNGYVMRDTYSTTKMVGDHPSHSTGVVSRAFYQTSHHNLPKSVDSTEAHHATESTYGEYPSVPASSIKNRSNGLTSNLSTDKLHDSTILVQSGQKSYGKQHVLIDLNMNVKKGTIYGLIGSSGCGKTTLLSCIVGLRKLSKGKIYVCGRAPGEKGSGLPGSLVGYMPQEIALNGEFSIEEVCHYFGQIFGMEKSYIAHRIKYLVNLLDLKKCTGHINTLSGGQQRRASFIVALLHEPSILILDEPTVGVDPVLRANIWKHLQELVASHSTTVIITTHYIEEMRQANTIGIMRNGLLMTEESPTTLLEMHNANMLEEVVLKFCLNDEYSPQVQSELMANQPKQFEVFNPTMYNKDDVKNSQTHSKHRIAALTVKNFIVLMRNFGFVLFTFATPSLIVAIFCFAIGSNPRDLGIGILNHEIGIDCSNYAGLTACEPIELSCAFLKNLKSGRTFDLVPVESTQNALDKVDKAMIWGYIEFPENFSQNVYDRVLGKSTSNSTIRGSQIGVRLDMSSISIGLSIKKFIYDSYQAFTGTLLINCGANSTGLDTPVVFETPIYGSDNSKFTDFVAPGVAMGFLFFMSALTCGLAYIIEKKDGMLHRSLIAGVTTMEIMVSHFIPQFVVVLVQAILAFVIMFAVFEIPQIGSPILAFFLVLLSSVCGMTMGFMASTLFDEEKNAMMMAMALIFPNFLLAGLIWPIESLPGAFSTISLFLPGTLACQSIRAILLRGWGMSYYTVWIGFVSTTGWICVYITLTYVIYSIRK